MPDVFDLTEKYREQLINREESARRSILKDYRSVWNGLSDRIDFTIGKLLEDPANTASFYGQFDAELSALKEGEQLSFSPDKLAKVADLLLEKDAWNQFETGLDIGFESVADAAAEMTQKHGKELGKTAVDHALELMQAEINKQREEVKKKDAKTDLSDAKIADLKATVRDYVERAWQANQLSLQESFRRKAAEVAKNANAALRREVMQGFLTGATGEAILARVKTAIDERERDPEKDPALVRSLRSEYRIRVNNGYRQSLRLTYAESGKVKKWRWTSARTARTCVVCWANDGLILTVGSTMPTHPHCRCVLVPVVEDATPAKRPGGGSGGGGRNGFSQLAAADQRSILGVKAFEAYQNGEFDLADLVGIQYNQRFGVMMYRQSVDQARVNARQRQDAKEADAKILNDPTLLIDGPLPTGGGKKKIKTIAVPTDLFIDVDDGANKMTLSEMTVERFWEIKKGFVKGNITIPVNAEFLKDQFGDFLTPKQVYWQALLTLNKQFYFKEEALKKFFDSITDLYFQDAQRTLVTNENLAEAVEAATQPTGKRTDDNKYIWVVFSAKNLQALYRLGLQPGVDDAKIENHEYQVQYLARLEELEKSRPKVNSILFEAFWAMHRDTVLKDFTREFQARITRDLRDPNNAGVNSFSDSVANFFRTTVQSHPVYRYLPDSVKEEIVEFGIGGVNGAVSLIGSVVGIGAFISDATFDVLVYGARQIGLDKKIPGFDAYVQQNMKMREERKDFFNKYSNLQTKAMANEVKAYERIVGQGIPTHPWDTPNWSASAGNLGVQAIPFIALAIATGGTGAIAEGAILATAQGGITLGGTYISTNNYRQAVIAGGMATVQGAVGGFANRLPFAANLAADALTTYTFGKISGQSDDEIFRQLVLQTGFAVGMAGKQGAKKYFSERSFAPGGEINAEMLKLYNQRNPDAQLPELGSKLAKAEFMEFLARQVGKSSQEVAKDIRARQQTEEVIRQIGRENAAARSGSEKPVRTARLKENAAKLLAEYGRQNKLVTSESATATRQALAKKINSTTLYSGIDPTLAAPLAKLAAYHVEAGIRTFTDFVRMMKAEWKGRPLTLDQYETAYREAVKEVNEARAKSGDTEAIKVDEAEIAKIKQEAERLAAAAEKTKNAKTSAKDTALTSTKDTTPGAQKSASEMTAKPAQPKPPALPPKAMRRQQELLTQREALKTEAAKQAYDAMFKRFTGGKGDVKKQAKDFRQRMAEFEDAAQKTQKSLDELLVNQNQIEAFRKQNKLPAFKYGGTDNGTVASVSDGTNTEFGLNVRTAKKAASIKDRGDTPRINVLEKIQNTLGKLKSEKYGVGKTQFLKHAESEALIKLGEARGGRLPGELAMYVDRVTCGQCRDGLPLLVELYGVKKLTIIDSYGHVYEVTPIKTTKIK